MTTEFSRRQFILAGAAGLVGTACGRNGARAQEGSPAGGPLTAYQDGPQIWVRHGDRILTSYRAHPTQKYPYFYPFTGPLSGRSLTTETGLPWPHHRSVFLGCDRVNGGNYWQDSPAAGQIVSQTLRLGDVRDDAVELWDECAWLRPGESPVLVDERRFQVRLVSPQLWWLDVRMQLTAQQPLRIEKSNHSLFAVRAAAPLAPAGGGRLVNSRGQIGEKETFGQAADWCDFSGTWNDDGQGLREGIALLDHPQNPWSPCPWFTRDYGFMSPTGLNWLNDGAWEWDAGQQVTLLYRLIAHAGDPIDADIASIFANWV